MRTYLGRETESRAGKTLRNARVGVIFYFLTLVLGFYSRKIFLDHLGAEFIGLAGTLGNILEYLNLAEFGIGTAVGFNLYRPLRHQDRREVNRLVSQYGFYYAVAGTVVGAGALVVSAFFPLMFDSDGLPLPLIYFTFYSFVISTLTGYFVNYRQILLESDQRQYVVSIYSQSAAILKALLQILLAWIWGNLYVWVGIELIFGLTYPVVLRRKIRRLYPWLKASISEGRSEHRRNPALLRTTARVFIHKFKDFFLRQSDQVLVFAFVSLKMVAFYGNYTLVVTRVMGAVTAVMGSAGASVGNLVAEGEKQRIVSVFWELMSLRYMVAGVLTYCVATLIQPFVVLWLGEEYLLSEWIVWLLAAYTFVMLTRITVDEFNHAYGHYGDVWAAWVEGAVNITVTVLCAWQWGIVGLLIGKLASVVPIAVFWKPLYLYRDGFNEPYSRYWAGAGRCCIAFAAAWVCTVTLLHALTIDAAGSFGRWIAYAALNILTFGGIYSGLLYLMAPGFDKALLRVRRLLVHR